MPSRILREGIITSEAVNSLSEPAENLYRRLFSIVDDYGRYYGHPSLIRAACYPLRVDSMTDKEIQARLDEMTKAKLVVIYVVNNKKYIEISNFNQRQRSDSKFPAQCPHNDRTMTSLVVDVDVDVCVDEGVNMSGKPDVPKVNYKQTATDILSFLNEKTGRNYKFVDANLKLIIDRLKEGYTDAEIRQVIALMSRKWKGDEKMDNYLRPKTLFNKTNMANYSGELKKV